MGPPIDQSPSKPIRDLGNKLAYLINYDRKHRVSGCQMDDIKDLARTIGSSPYTFRDRIDSNDLGTRHNRNHRPRLDADLEQRVADVFHLDLTSEQAMDEWSNSPCVKHDKDEFQGRFTSWYEDDQRKRRTRDGTRRLALVPERARPPMRFAGLARLSTRASDLDFGSARVFAEVVSHDLDHESVLVRIERIQVELHVWPANLADDHWSNWHRAIKIPCSNSSPNATVRAIEMPQQKQRYLEAKEPEEQRAALKHEDWIRSPYFEIFRGGEELGTAAFEVGRIENLTPGDLIWAAAGVRKRDVKRPPRENVRDMHTARPNSPMKKRVLEAFMDRRAWRTLTNDEEAYRSPDDYFVFSWHTLLFLESGK